MTLTDFLLARIAEAEAKARDWWQPTEDCPPYTIGGTDPDVVYVETPQGCEAAIPKDDFYARYMRRVDPDPFTLADCEAKRRVVKLCEAEDIAGTDGAVTAVSVLHLLALPYAEHPDHREEWRP